MPVLRLSGIEPAAERGSKCEDSVGVTCFEHCSPFSPCKGAWLSLDRPVEDMEVRRRMAVFSGDLLAVGGGDVG